MAQDNGLEITLPQAIAKEKVVTGKYLIQWKLFSFVLVKNLFRK